MTDWDDRVPPGDEPDSEETPESAAESAPEDVTEEQAETTGDSPGAESQAAPWRPGGYPWPVETQGSDEQTPTDAPAATEASAGVRALLVVMGLLVVMVLVVGGFALKLWFDRLAAQEALGASARAISLTMSPTLADTLEPRLKAVNEAAERGHFAEVTTRLDNILRGMGGKNGAGAEGVAESSPFPGPNIAMPPAGGPGQAPGQRPGPNPPGGRGRGERSGGSADTEELPPAALAFFQQHPDIGKLVGQANMMGIQLRDRGGDVTKLREIRKSIIEAARLQDADKVLELLKEFDTEFKKRAAKFMGPPPGMRQGPGGRPGQQRGGPPQPPKRFLTMARRCGEALREAQMAGRDVRPALQFMRQGEQAAMAGNFDKAMEMTRKALAALKKAPSMPAQPKLFENPIVHMLLDLMRVEDGELKDALTNLRNTYEAAKTTTVQELSKSMSGAIGTLERVGKRRQSVGQQLETIRTGKQSPPSPEEMRKQAEEMQAKARERVEATRGDMGKILERARALSPEEFGKERDALLDEILNLIFPPRPGAPGADSGEPGETAKPADLPAEDRVRQKLLNAAEPFLKVKADPARKELATELADLFRRSREMLAKRDYTQAEMLADRALALMGIGPSEAGSTPTDAPQGPEKPSEPGE